MAKTLAACGTRKWFSPDSNAQALNQNEVGAVSGNSQLIRNDGNDGREKMAAWHFIQHFLFLFFRQFRPSRPPFIESKLFGQRTGETGGGRREMDRFSV